MSEKQKYNSNSENLSLEERGGFLGNYAKDVKQGLESLETSKKQDIGTLKDVIMKISSMDFIISKSDNEADRQEIKNFLNRAMKIVSEYLVVLDDKEGLLSSSEKQNFEYLKDVFSTCEKKLDAQNQIRSKVQEQIERIKKEIQMRTEDKRESIVERGVVSSDIKILDDRVILKDDGKTLELVEGKGFKLDPSGITEWRRSHSFSIENLNRDIQGIEEGDEIDILAPFEVKENNETRMRNKRVMTLTKINGVIEVTDSTRYFDKVSTEINTPIENIDINNAEKITDVISNVDLINQINTALRWDKEETNSYLTYLISQIKGFENIANLDEVLVVLKEQPELLPKFNEDIDRISNMLLTTSGKKISLINKIQGQEKETDEANEAFIEKKKLEEQARAQAEKIGTEANLNESSIEKLRKAIFEGWVKVRDNENGVLKDTHAHLSYGDKGGIGLHQTILELKNKDGVELNLALGVGFFGGQFHISPVGSVGYHFTEKTSGRVYLSAYGVGADITVLTEDDNRVSLGLFAGPAFGIVAEFGRDIRAKLEKVMTGEKVLENATIDSNNKLTDFTLNTEIKTLSSELYEKFEASKGEIIKLVNNMAEVNNLTKAEHVEALLIALLSGDASKLSNEVDGLHFQSIMGGIFFGLPIVGASFAELDAKKVITEETAFKAEHLLINGRDSDNMLFASSFNGETQCLDYNEILANAKETFVGGEPKIRIWKHPEVRGTFENNKVYVTEENIAVKEFVVTDTREITYVIYPIGYDLNILRTQGLTTVDMITDGVAGTQFNNMEGDLAKMEQANLQIEKAYEEAEQLLNLDKLFSPELEAKAAELKYRGITGRDEKLFGEFDTSTKTLKGDLALQYCIYKYFEKFNKGETVDYTEMYELVSRMELFAPKVAIIETMKDPAIQAKAKLVFINRIGDLFLNVKEIQRAKAAEATKHLPKGHEDKVKAMYKTLNIFDLNVGDNKKLRLDNAYDLATYTGLAVEGKGKKNLQEVSFKSINDEHIRYLITRELVKVPPMDASRFLGAIEEFNNLGLNWRKPKLEDQKAYIDLVKGIGAPTAKHNILGFTVADHFSLDKDSKGLMPIVGSGEFVSTREISLEQEDKAALLKNLENKGILDGVKAILKHVFKENFKNLKAEQVEEVITSILTTGKYVNQKENIDIALDAQYYEGLMGMSSSIALFMQNPTIKGHVGKIAVNIVLDGSSQTSAMSIDQIIQTGSYGISIGPSESKKDDSSSISGGGVGVGGGSGSGSGGGK